ncbi:MAG TPA: MmcQ/YjbR family DNA-binding protein [Pseudonocardiaceae bacterium]|jgi:predicted DNA-binding protein (MmcQ/YjbR family)|nr:MmcQ/YjbR family DNA-binding protein [Pseudonocardiaceae bacterium]
MTPEQVATVALGMAEVTEERPFGPDVDVYKVRGKVFVIASPRDEPPRVTLKCEPSLAVHLREQYPAVTPGYHTNKRLWNTVLLDGSIPGEEIEDMIDHSYRQVVAGFPKDTRIRLIGD